MAPRIDPTLADLQPVARSAFTLLYSRVHTKLSKVGITFGIFEVFRSPARQSELIRQGTSKAGPWQSPHQYGLAVDFVPVVAGKWTWEPPQGNLAWDALDEEVAKIGVLRRPINWDRPHVEHVAWYDLNREVRRLLR